MPTAYSAACHLPSLRIRRPRCYAATHNAFCACLLPRYLHASSAFALHHTATLPLTALPHTNAFTSSPLLSAAWYATHLLSELACLHAFGGRVAGRLIFKRLCTYALFTSNHFVFSWRDKQFMRWLAHTMDFRAVGCPNTLHSLCYSTTFQTNSDILRRIFAFPTAFSFPTPHTAFQYVRQPPLLCRVPY